MKLLRGVAIFAFLIQCSQLVCAQNSTPDITDALLKKFEYYSIKKQQGVLYAHFDKTIYTTNENIWFTAYLLKGDSVKNDILSIAMINDVGREVALKDKFKMKGNVASGNLFVADTIPSGNYSFLLYTNSMVNGLPENVFIQPVTIRNTTPAVTFRATLFLQDTGKVAPLAGRKVLLITEASGQILAGAKVSYYLGDKISPIISGTVKTDAAGQYLFTIPNNIPANANTLQAQVTVGSEVKLVKLALPVEKKTPVVRFYPEGGNLSDGVTSVVGWEVKNAEGGVQGTLYKDDKAVDTVSTNDYGMGKFKLLPQVGSRYYVKLNLTDVKDSVYNLPKILSNAPVISVANSLASDNLDVVVKSKTPAKYYVLVHNYNQAFVSVPVMADADGKSVQVSLANVPKGLAEVTILDSQQQPFAERLFFAHYDKRDVASIDIDNAEYKPRQKINLKLKLTGADGKPLTGNVSIACVQANRIEANKVTDIESYFYLNNELGMFPLKQNYLGGSAADKAFLENVLLIKGWRRYTWNELMQTTKEDAISYTRSLEFKGVITDLNKPLKKSVLFTETRDSSRKAFTSMANGSFFLDDNDMYVRENEKIHLFVTSDLKEDYIFSLADPYVKINQELSTQYDPSYSYVTAIEKKEAPETIKGFEHAIQLKEVRIKGVSDSLMNACGDYFCINGILNCPNHHHDPGNQVPVKGKTYYIFNPLTEQKRPFVYRGCNPDDFDAAKGFTGVHYAIEFYPADYAIDNPRASDYLSTIYWNNLNNITPGTDANISFYASDVTGAFKIVVQGTTDKGVIYGEKSFTVNK